MRSAMHNSEYFYQTLKKKRWKVHVFEIVFWYKFVHILNFNHIYTNVNLEKTTNYLILAR